MDKGGPEMTPSLCTSHGSRKPASLPLALAWAPFRQMQTEQETQADAVINGEYR